MKNIKAGLKVKLGLANPYQIKPQYRLFSQSHNIATIKFVNKFKINYDTYITRFHLPKPNQCLGIKIGQYSWIRINEDKRPYVPISAIDEPGIIDFLIRDLSRLNKSSFTQKILNLTVSDELCQENSQVEIEGPGTQFIYNGFGKIIYENKPQKKYKNIGIITHASGITTTFTLIESITQNFDHQTAVTLFWLGDTNDDFVLLNQLVSFCEQNKLNMNLMLTKYEKGWMGPYGKVLPSHIRDYLPHPKDDTFIIMSALEGQLEGIKQLIIEEGYSDYIYV